MEADDIALLALREMTVTSSVRGAIRRSIIEAANPDAVAAHLQARLFAHFRQAAEIAPERGPALLGLLEELLEISRQGYRPPLAYFSPGHDCLESLIALILNARATLDVCVFTITDNRISRQLQDAHERRGVKIRLITDEIKRRDEGSDIAFLLASGIAVATNAQQKEMTGHMHHKFMLVDGHTLVTGSYNWTRNAARFNAENLIATSEPGLFALFQSHFEELWRLFPKLEAQSPKRDKGGDKGGRASGPGRH